jgi:hypothetical protein
MSGDTSRAIEPRVLLDELAFFLRDHARGAPTAARTGQVLVADAPAAGVGWP